MRRLSASWALLLALVGASMVAAVYIGSSLALFTDTASVTDNTFTTDTLDPPTGLAASVVGTDIQLDWTATADTYATGYKVLRSTTQGSGYSEIDSVTPYTATTYTDSTVSGGTTYYYVLQSYYQNWTSAESNEASATAPSGGCTPGSTGFMSPAGEAADTGGDGDGFELNPTNAFADGGGYAEDIDGGSAAATACDTTVWMGTGTGPPVSHCRERLAPHRDSARPAGG